MATEKTILTEDISRTRSYGTFFIQPQTITQGAQTVRESLFDLATNIIRTTAGVTAGAQVLQATAAIAETSLFLRTGYASVSGKN